MATRNTGAKDLGGSGTVGAGGLAPGAITGTQLQASNPIDFQSAIDAAVAPPRLPPIDPTNRAQVIWRQTELRNLGIDIVVDGVYGPITKWYEAMVNNGDWHPPSEFGEAGGGNWDGSPITAPPPPPPPAPPAPTRRSGGGGAATTVIAPPAIPTPTRQPLGDDWIEQARAQYPALAGLLDVPEIRGVAREALENEWPPERVIARFQNTEWFKNTPARTRQWIGLMGSDPATARQQVAETAAQFRDLAKKYLVPLSDDTLSTWATKTLSGETLENGFLEYVKEQAKSRRPHLAKAIDEGFTVEQYYEPYREQAAQLLEISPTSIDLNDPKWARAIDGVDPQTGMAAPMPLYEWANVLRTDGTYGYDRTEGARSEAARLAERINQTFGRVG